MNNLKAAIDAAQEKDYIEFEKSIHKEMEARIQNDPYIKKRSAEMNKYQAIADTYKIIQDLNAK